MVLGISAGCAAQKSTSPTTMAVTRPVSSSNDHRAFLTLDQVPDRPQLGPSTQPEDIDPPIQALELFAKGTDLMAQNQPAEAAQAFEDAIKLDSKSYDLYVSLSEALLQQFDGPTPAVVAALEHASQIRPNNLHLQLMLAQYEYNTGAAAGAIHHLRLAVQTTDYQQNSTGSALAELFLARLLQEQGYDRAAIQLYEKFTGRLADSTNQMVQEPGLDIVLQQPQVIWVEMGSLYERHGQWAAALDVYSKAAQADPLNLQHDVNIVSLLLKLKGVNEATAHAADVVGKFGGNPSSLNVLNELVSQAGSELVLDALSHILTFPTSDKNRNRGAALSLAEIRIQNGDPVAARRVLESAHAGNVDDAELFRGLFNFYLHQNDDAAAAALLVDQLRAQPESTDQVLAIFDQFLRPLPDHPLKVQVFQNLAVPDSAQPAKLFLIAQLAAASQRDSLSQSSIDQVLKIRPPFAPAFRQEAQRIWSRSDLTQDQKIKNSDDAAALAEKGGDEALAAEVRGIALLEEAKFSEAQIELEKAVGLGGNSADLQLELALAYSKQGKTLQYEQQLWKSVSEHSRFETAWDTLFNYFFSAKRSEEAWRTLAQWLMANPASPDARRYDALRKVQNGQTDEAERELVSLLEEFSTDRDVLVSVGEDYVSLRNETELVSRLEQIRNVQPTNRVVARYLMELFRRDDKLGDARQVLDQTRTAIESIRAGSSSVPVPVMLYQLSALYQELNDVEISQEVLVEVLKIDPQNVEASNDLGFAWADAGTNLDRAEQMIRHAVQAEPDNAAYLDSLGWVLYKESKFSEAQTYFSKAVDPATEPDSEILDHYGDVLYRLGQTDGAEHQWQRILDQPSADDAKDGPEAKLRQQVRLKLAQAQAGGKVNVAPLPLPTANGKK